MADKYPTINGNWSNPLIWNGLSVPTASDDVYADGKAVVIDQNVTVLSIRTTQRSGGTTGGSFTISAAGITVNCTSSGILSATSGGALLITATTGTTTLNSNITGGVSTGGNACTLSGATTLVIAGNLLAGTGTNTHALSVSSTSTINITGNITGVNAQGILITSGATLNVTGNVIGGNNGSVFGISNTTLAATINITGNVTAQTGAGISSTIASVVTVKGIITSSNTIAGVSLSSTSSSLTFSGQAINNNGVMAIFCAVVRLYTNDPVQWTFQNNTGGTKILYSAGILLGYPAITNVRNGTTYGASSELTGTLIMAIPANVRRGVNTDATVGTADLTAQDIFSEIASSSDPIAVRLKNIATVQTTGAQLASYN